MTNSRFGISYYVRSLFRVMGPHVHYTRTKRVQAQNGSGWEFSCRQCSYRVRYIQLNEHDKRTLEIIDIGDPTARHTNNILKGFVASDLQDRVEQPDQIVDEDTWLTKELRQQIDIILGKFTWDW
jgi:hypothetical protein